MFLHVISKNAISLAHAGSYKDIISRVNWFRAQPTEYRQVMISDDVGELQGLPPADAVQGILVEYTHFPKTIASLRARYPRAFIAARAHNIEPLQHFHANGWWPQRGPAWMLYGMWRRFRQDMLCKRYCDAIYSINSYENRVYWDRLPGSAQIKWLPYHCPEHLIPEHILPFADRNIIACLPGDLSSRRNRDMVLRFLSFAEALKSGGAPFRFVVSGDLSAAGLPRCEAVESAGMIGNLAAFLGEVRAVAVLSPLGYGLKTTIVDAVACGAVALAHPMILKHSPEELLPALISVDTEKSFEPKVIERIIDRLNSPSRVSEIDRDFRIRSVTTLEQDFGSSASVQHTPREEGVRPAQNLPKGTARAALL